MALLSRYGAMLLATLTALSEVAHIEHLFSQEWVVLLLAVLTAVVAFFASRDGGGAPDKKLPT